MSMTLVNAKIYVARVLGGAQNQEVIDMAAEAILRGYQDWQAQRFWRFLLKDTSIATAVSGITATGASASVTAPSTGAFDFVNVGQTVTISTGTATLAADTTVSSVTRNTSGVVTAITLSNAFGGTTNSSATLTFSADIPVIAGSNDYALPNDYNASATARLLTNPVTMAWRTPEYWDRLQPDDTLQGTPSEFTTYNPYSPLTQNFGDTRLKFDKVPAQNDTLRLRYFRRFTVDGTNIDMPDEVLYKFLDYCRSLLLEAKRAQDDPAGYRSSVLDSMKQAEQNDDQPNSESDAEECIKSQYEMWPMQPPLWRNGEFDPFRS